MSTRARVFLCAPPPVRVCAFVCECVLTRADDGGGDEALHEHEDALRDVGGAELRHLAQREQVLQHALLLTRQVWKRTRNMV